MNALENSNYRFRPFQLLGNPFDRFRSVDSSHDLLIDLLEMAFHGKVAIGDEAVAIEHEQDKSKTHCEKLALICRCHTV